MQRISCLLVILMLLITHGSAKTRLVITQNDSISVSITLSPNSSVSLKRNPNGKYSGDLYLSAQQTDHQKTHTTSQPISADTVASLLTKIIDLGLLDIAGNDIRVIDGFRARFTITQMHDERKFSLVPGLNNKDSEKAGKIIQLLSDQLQNQKKLYAYLNTLPAGIYHVGMLTVKVYELGEIGGKKSSLYLSYEDSFKKNRIYIPLYVIDGKPIEPIELNNYEVEDIKKVEVLKGAAAAALYGVRAANGVVVLTTK